MKTFICIIMVAMATVQVDGTLTNLARTIDNIFAPSQPAQPVDNGDWQIVDQPQGTIVDQSEWYTVPNDYVPQGTRNTPAVAPVSPLSSLIPALALAGLAVMLMDYFNISPVHPFIDNIKRSNPQVAEVMAAIEESLPAEGRSLENLLPMAKQAFEAIEKFTALNEQ